MHRIFYGVKIMKVTFFSHIDKLSTKEDYQGFKKSMN